MMNPPRTTCSGLVLLLTVCFCRLAAAQTVLERPTKDNLDLPYTAVGEHTEEESLVETIVFYGQTYEGDGFFFVVDRSGTMQDKGELDAAKREIARNLSELSTGVEFAVIFFDRGMLKFPAGNQPLKTDRATKQAALAWVQSITGGSGSCCEHGLLEALKFADNAVAARKVIVLVGDGKCNCMERKTLLAITKSRNQARAQIHTIGVIEPDRDFLKQLAAMHGGAYTEIQR